MVLRHHVPREAKGGEQAIVGEDLRFLCDVCASQAARLCLGRSALCRTWCAW